MTRDTGKMVHQKRTAVTKLVPSVMLYVSCIFRRKGQQDGVLLISYRQTQAKARASTAMKPDVRIRVCGRKETYEQWAEHAETFELRAEL